MNKENKRYYPCYSYKEKNYLMDMKQKYLLQCKHKDSNCLMWIFLYEDDKDLDKYLEKWKTIRNLNLY